MEAIRLPDNPRFDRYISKGNKREPKKRERKRTVGQLEGLRVRREGGREGWREGWREEEKREQRKKERKKKKRLAQQRSTQRTMVNCVARDWRGGFNSSSKWEKIERRREKRELSKGRVKGRRGEKGDEKNLMQTTKMKREGWRVRGDDGGATQSSLDFIPSLPIDCFFFFF